MPEIYPQFDVVFSKDEIEEILRNRAQEILRDRGRGDVVLTQVRHVEGAASVVVTFDHKKGKRQ